MVDQKTRPDRGTGCFPRYHPSWPRFRGPLKAQQHVFKRRLAPQITLGLRPKLLDRVTSIVHLGSSRGNFNRFQPG